MVLGRDYVWDDPGSVRSMRGLEYARRFVFLFAGFVIAFTAVTSIEEIGLIASAIFVLIGVRIGLTGIFPPGALRHGGSLDG